MSHTIKANSPLPGSCRVVFQFCCRGDTGESELLDKWLDSCSLAPLELAGPAGGAEEAIGIAY